jgi:hypothetical protein
VKVVHDEVQEEAKRDQENQEKSEAPAGAQSVVPEKEGAQGWPGRFGCRKTQVCGIGGEAGSGRSKTEVAHRSPVEVR